ncbi:MAG: lipocalin family protein [Alloprevotella sp.]
MQLLHTLTLSVCCAGLTALTSCGTASKPEVSIVGSWTEPVPGMPQMAQGFTLADGGKAESVNMATLLYEHWTQQGDTLCLSGKSIGNQQTIDFTDTLLVKRLTADTLVLQRGEQERIYTRSK